MDPELTRLIRSDLPTFAQKAHLALRGHTLVWHPYVDVVLDDVRKIHTGAVKRFIVNMPPGHGKTFFFSVVLPAWHLAHNPSEQILLISYGQDLAEGIAYDIRKLLMQSWFKACFSTRIAADRSRVFDFQTTAGGALYATSIGGTVTGKRGNLIIIDDPLQIGDAGNAKKLAAVNEFYASHIENRANNPEIGRIVLVQHRLSRHDLTAFLLDWGGWGHRVLPIIAEGPTTFVMSNGATWHRPVGDILRPDAFAPEYIEKLRRRTGAPGFGPLYQQSFEAPDYVSLSVKDFVIERSYSVPDVPFVLSIDPAAKADGESFSVVQAWACLADGHFLLFDQNRSRSESTELKKVVSRMTRQYRPTVVLIERSGFGFALEDQLRDTTVIMLQPTQSKLQRLREVLPMFRSGRVKLRKNSEWYADYITEMLEFPNGKFDDQVDATSQFLSWIGKNELPKRAPKPSRAIGALGNRRLEEAKILARHNLGYPSRPYIFERKR